MHWKVQFRLVVRSAKQQTTVKEIVVLLLHYLYRFALCFYYSLNPWSQKKRMKWLMVMWDMPLLYTINANGMRVENNCCVLLFYVLKLLVSRNVSIQYLCAGMLICCGFKLIELPVIILFLLKIVIWFQWEHLLLLAQFGMASLEG